MTPKDVAAFMLAEFGRQKFLYQEDIVYKIKDECGDEFTYLNANGNLAIRKKVLDEFRKLTSDSVVWSRSEKAWRKREEHDSANRQQE